MILLKISGLARSVYYYTLSKNDKDDKNKEIIDKIKEIFINNWKDPYRHWCFKSKNSIFDSSLTKKTK